MTPFWGQSPKIFHPVGYYLSHNNYCNLNKFLDETQWDEEVKRGVVVQVKGTPMRVRILLTADHQLHVRMGAARGTNCHTNRCVYCDTNAKVCHLHI
jgi:hypothetical protein